MKGENTMVLVQCHDCGFQLLTEEETVLQERWLSHSRSTGDEKKISLGAYSAFEDYEWRSIQFLEV